MQLQAQSEKIPPRTLQLQTRRDVRQLTNISKNLYNIFNMFELEASRLCKFNTYLELMSQLRVFNDQIEKWKKNTHQIANLRLTYSLYENLFSRMKYISNFSKSEQQSAKAIQSCYKWFFEQKPKLRCQVKQPTAQLKTYHVDPKQSQKVDRMLQHNIVKRQMEAYQMMSRTAHPGMFPPKELLKQYKRKLFLPFSTTDSQPNQKTNTIKKSTSASLLSKNRLSKYRMSVGTLLTSATSMKQTKQQMSNTITQFKISNIEQKKVEEQQQQKQKQKQGQQQINQQNIDQIERQNKVEKQQIMQENLVQQLGEEDAPDAEDQNIFQDQDIKKQNKIFIRDHDPEDIEYAKQLSKQNEQSTLRRVMKVNQEKIRSKLQDLDLRRNMQNWAKIKGNNNKEQSRKLQVLLNCNKYKDLAYKKKGVSFAQDPILNRNGPKLMASTTGFTDSKKFKQPTVVPMLYRSKSSNPTAMQSDIQKMKIKQIYHTYGRYINHLPMPTTPQQVPQQQQKKPRHLQNMAPPEIRAMSLTCLSSTAQKNHFSNILSNNNPHAYNQGVQQQIIRIKTSLSKKGAPIQKGTIYKALSSVPPQQIQTSIGFYTAGRDLLSNPFFPKNIGKKKKKK